VTREAPRDFLRILREYDPDLDCRWNARENVWVLWRQSRGRWVEELALGPEELGEWTIRYLAERDVLRRFRRGMRGYRQWLHDRAEARRRAVREESRGRVRDAIHENWRRMGPALRDDVAEQTAFTVQGLKG